MNTPAEQLFPDDDLALLGLKIEDRYLIRDLLGKGGMGVVYLADHQGLKKLVALKVLSASWASDEKSIQRFQREAQSASRVNHPHIVPVYDSGCLDDGRPYFSMEYCKGASLSEVLSIETHITLGRAIKVVTEAAAGLDAVHAEGIIHRDIKPENFFISWTPKDGEQVKLLDFGLAAFISPEEHMEKLTRKGQMHGTPHYMSPEMAGEESVDHRADIYSLAVVAFELLTGKLPFDDDNPFTILHQKCKEDPPSLSSKSEFSFPKQLEQVMAKGLALRQEDRYARAGQFADDFQKAILQNLGWFPSEMFDELLQPYIEKMPPDIRDKASKELQFQLNKTPRLEVVTPRSVADRTQEDRDQQQYKSIPVEQREKMETPYAVDSDAFDSEINSKQQKEPSTLLGLLSKKKWILGLGFGLLALFLIYYFRF